MNIMTTVTKSAKELAQIRTRHSVDFRVLLVVFVTTATTEITKINVSCSANATRQRLPWSSPGDQHLGAQELINVTEC
ncbi:hypothetical protein ANCCAN_08294 [Ancylostoma caninum]|uniref:Uncharacterized protein n=1 Tax=Ancylostoma caninum TaxID=29170 RepID=A0A368GMX0_ANCCA|nr:hypothetical protein ANCCAN_08294 [Ancylostoma caninum]